MTLVHVRHLLGHELIWCAPHRCWLRRRCCVTRALSMEQLIQRIIAREWLGEPLTLRKLREITKCARCSIRPFPLHINELNAFMAEDLVRLRERARSFELTTDEARKQHYDDYQAQYREANREKRIQYNRVWRRRKKAG